jgi:feruloyl-CoA synthase
MTTESAKAPLRDVNLGTLGVTIDRWPDGHMVVRSKERLLPYPDNLTVRLDEWAKATPNQTFLAQRTATGEWRHVTYAQARQTVRAIANALRQRNLGPERPIAILSGNDIEHALLMLAAMTIGIPVAPISVAYSLMSSDHERLRYIIGRLTPGLVYASTLKAYDKAIDAAVPPHVEVITTAGPQGFADAFGVSFDVPLTASYAAAVDALHAKVGPDTVAKIMFTSGSTGLPKGVINTQRMLCANQAMLQHWLAFVREEPPVLVDWLPWSHTFGGNHNFGLVLSNGGSLYIDDGKPVPAAFPTTVRNLKDIAPTLYFNVPKGYESLVAAMKQDPALREKFFSRLQLLFYSGAGLPPHIAAELDELSIQTTGKRVLMVTSLGSTETAPAALSCSKQTAAPGVVGVPLPGVSLKLIPSSGKLEARVAGPTMMPGYWRDPEQTAKVFDADGYYMLGDALKFAEGEDPSKGFVFDGRVAEDFKLLSGTWASVGTLRPRFLSAMAPLAKDAVIAGHDRDDIRALVIPDLDACAALVPDAKLAPADLLAHPAVHAAFKARLTALAKGGEGSSTRIVRVALMVEPPSIDASEITDKGSLNQRAVLQRRASIVEDLYAATASPLVVGI